MATMAPVHQSSNWMRLGLSVNICVKDALLHIVHHPHYGGLPTDEQQLHARLLQFRQSHGNQLRAVIKPYQWEKLCHVCSARTNCQLPCQRNGRTDLKDVDITTLVPLIIHLVPNLPPPIGGWAQALPQATDTSKAANVLRARDIRNKVNHCSIQDVVHEPDFDDYWNLIKDVLIRLGYNNMQFFTNLKTAPLEPLLQQQIDVVTKTLLDRINTLNGECDDKADLVDQQRTQHELDLLKKQIAECTSKEEFQALEKRLGGEVQEANNELNSLKLDIAKLDVAIKDDDNKVAIYNVQMQADQNTELSVKNQTALKEVKTMVENAHILAEQNANEVKTMVEDVHILAEQNTQLSVKNQTAVNGMKMKMEANAAENTKLKQNKNNEELSLEMKRKTRMRYETVRNSFQAIQSSLSVPTKVGRDEIIVHLSLLNNVQKVFALEETKSLSVWKKREILRDISESIIDYKEILTSLDDYILISGGPGYGKTTLIETLLYRWSCNDLWNDTQEDGVSFQFVFLVNFRQLTRFRNDQSITAEKILKHFYPQYFFHEQPFWNNSLLILEGFDELVAKEQLRKKDEDLTPFERAVFDLLDPNNQQIPFTRIVTSRPESCSILSDSILNQDHDKIFRCLEVSGFSQESVILYIKNNIKEELRKKELIELFQGDALFSSMMRVPFHCGGICYLFNNSVPGEEFPITRTGLYVSLLILFIRNHGTVRNTSRKLIDVVNDPNFKTTILTLSKMAYQLEEEKKICFTQNDVSEDLDELLEKSGLIIKIESNGFDGPSYQFLHYSFHEFLVAINVLWREKPPCQCDQCHNEEYDIRIEVQINSIHRIFIFGLSGCAITNSNSNKTVQTFAKLFCKPDADFNSAIKIVFWGTIEREISLDKLLEYTSEFQNKVTAIDYLDIISSSYTFGSSELWFLQSFEQKQKETKIEFHNLDVQIWKASEENISSHVRFLNLSVCSEKRLTVFFSIPESIEEFVKLIEIKWKSIGLKHLSSSLDIIVQAIAKNCEHFEMTDTCTANFYSILCELRKGKLGKDYALKRLEFIEEYSWNVLREILPQFSLEYIDVCKEVYITVHQQNNEINKDDIREMFDDLMNFIECTNYKPEHLRLFALVYKRHLKDDIFVEEFRCEKHFPLS